ncbi:MAG: flagellar biosynthesis protein FlhB [Planctomycetes bacterium]|nr:flagellar biosynthesis protein FlhB [Planctomycetota bacterium]
MAADDAGEKTEAPTARRRQEARSEGRVARSVDLTAAIGLLGGLLLLNVFGTGMFGTLMTMARALGDDADISGAQLVTWIGKARSAAIGMLVPFLALLLILTAAGALVQSGLLLTWKKLQPDLKKVNPLQGIKRLVSPDSLARLGMGVLKMSLVGVVAYYSVLDEIELVVSSGSIAPRGILSLASHVAFTLGIRLGLLLLILAILDYFYQRWRHERSLRMTKQEVKDEMKRMEGDPLLKSRRRQIQANLAMQRIRMDVPKSDVVVTNPTEYAVALRYDEATMAAPRVMAKGQNLLALHIRQVAQQHGVPIVQRPPLARALYASADVGDEVPPQFYRAVAEVLAYVYQLTGRAAG